MFFGDGTRLRARALALVREPEQRADVADGEAEPARAPDEIQALEVLGPVEPKTS